MQRYLKIYNKKWPYLIVFLSIASLLSCGYKNEVGLVKKQKIIFPSELNLNDKIDPTNNNLTLGNLYNEIALLINGKVEYNTSDLTIFKEDYQKYLSEKFPLSKYVLVKIYNHSDTICGWGLYAVNTRLNVVEIVDGSIGEDKETYFGYVFNAKLFYEYQFLKNSKEYRDSYNMPENYRTESNKKDSILDSPDPVYY